MDSESRQATSEASRLTGSRKRSPSTTSEDSTRPGKKPRLDSARTENVPAPQRGPFFSYPANSVDLSEQTVGELLKDDSDESEDSIPDTTHLPLRMLDSFTFFTGDDSGPERQILGLEQLEHGRRVQIIGYGDVRSVDADPEEEGALDEDHEDAEENSQTYRYRYFPCLLGPVIEWWTGDGVTNFDMYIRTQSAWYLLETPSAVYRKIFSKFWRLHRIPQLAVEFATKSPQDGLLEFKSSLVRVNDAKLVIGRALTDDDVDFAISAGIVKGDLACLSPRLSSNIAGSRLIDEIMESYRHRRPISEYKARSKAPPPGSTMSQERKTVVSPLVSNIAQRCFRHQLEVVGPRVSHLSFDLPPQERTQRRPNVPMEGPTESDITDARGVKKAFYKVLSEQGGTSYEIGDCVAIKMGQFRDQRTFDPPASGNKLADESWFGVIRYLFTISDDPNAPHEVISWAHVQWFYHGSCTDIGELASPHELFLSYECDDIGLATIKKLVHVEYVKSTSKEIIPSGIGIDSTFFCRLRYDNADGSFQDLSQPHPHKFSDIDFTEEEENLLNCNGCLTKLYSDTEHGGHIFQTPKSNQQPEGGFNYGNVTYHRYDTILYVAPADERNLTGEAQQTERLQLQVGIIHRWDIEKSVARTSYVTVRRLEFVEALCKQRADAIHLLPPMGTIPMDERQLYQTCDYVKIPIENIHRRCIVRLNPRWKPYEKLNSEPNEFFLTHDAGKNLRPTFADLKQIRPEDYQACYDCTRRIKANDKYYRHFTSRGQPDAEGNPRPNALDTLDLCCGAGGLSLGLGNSNVCDVKWAIDKDIESARTFRRNFPDALVFTQDLNECVHNALNRGNDRPMVESLDPQHQAQQHMPSPGRVKAIIAGPPCPDFSIQNVYRHTAGDARTGLVLAILSLIDHYRPKFFLIENVPGMLTHRAVDRETGEVVSGAMVKIILRTLTTLGYSVRWGLFNAANFGTPQQRTRLFFYGSQGGHRVPDVLIPTHITIKNSRTKYARPIGILTRLTTNVAALSPITLSTSIGDLPAFDWTVQDPHQNLGPRQGIPSFLGESRSADQLAGFKDREGRGYHLRRPMTLYQARMRAQVAPTDKVYLHVTKTFKESSKKAKRIIAVAMRPNADHRTIPRELNEWALSHALSAAARTSWAPRRYGRLDWEGQFQSFITRIDPTAKQGKVLHPSQRRLITVREAARAQGFPDHFTFCGDATS
ncbi:hypothetical protein FRC16_010154, partial [Serendipita sp. 398]